MRIPVLLAAGLAHVLLLAASGFAEPVSVTLERQGDGWRLLRAGKPYSIKGAGGKDHLDLLQASGGNSIRTWGADDLGPLLDEAEKRGLTVTVGFWLGHERHGFDYNNADQVAQQFAKCREYVQQYKDHPAVLMWAIGNEMEGYEKGDNAAIWSAINSIAAMTKQLDPHHPTMSVVAEIGGDRVKNLHRLCPEIDILGINSYGGALSLPKRYREAGGTKPYIVTEFGPAGSWETGRNAWGAAEEPTSTAKAERYQAVYAALAADRDLNLGSYAFIWGQKQEATATWFGMFLPTGEKLAAVDAMTLAWSGQPPANRCPVITGLAVQGETLVEPGAAVQVVLQASDPDNDPLTVRWELRRDAKNYNTGGDAQAPTTLYADAVTRSNEEGATLTMPQDGGVYRLYAFVDDGKQAAAVGNVLLKVKGPEPEAIVAKATLPLLIDANGTPEAPFIASGWMGAAKSIAMDPRSATQPHTGETCLRASYNQADAWGGVVWQHPAQDWGDQPGGRDLTGAKTLTFWARGEQGGEKVKFLYGLISGDKPFPDTAKGELTVELTTEWKQYKFDLQGKDLHRIKTPFGWVAAGQGKPIVFYLDGIQYE
ncbi:glycoside hydrolase family 2 TIM barrel-domain containing protein [Lignipirellula cremea]|uniref:Beta-D-glucuronidase n=1 Tax=Lignipirellula cremea TaxID=2528010 RepID=A0A518E152_9BACT|nr:glycoside hydrolase family 2 TIM barrel-domain containing protein [Lignipirellula cremea]QDU97791.1 beta-D-glucuronidase [Lignipirellula cremea]